MHRPKSSVGYRRNVRIVAARTRSVVIGVLIVGLATLIGGAAPGQAEEALDTLQPGEVVVAEQATGRVVRISADGHVEALLTDLGAVRGVVVLRDGAVIAADSQNGTLVGVGGRFGPEPTEVAEGLSAPEALALDDEQRLYVTS